MRKVVAAWADKNKVDVQLDFLTAIGNKIDLTMGAEAVAKTGHDIFAFDIWTVHQWSDELTPVDDVMSSLIDKYGPVAQANEYLAKINGHWMAVPTGSGSAPLTPCARISMLKQYAGIDVQAWYPAHEVSPPEAEDWTYDTQLKAAEACAKAGHAFGFGCGTTTDSVQTWGAMFGVRRRPGGRQRQHHRQFRQCPPGTGIREKDAAVPAAGYRQLRRRIQQPGADLREGRNDLQSALQPGRWPNATRRRSRRTAGPSPTQRERRAGWFRMAIFLGHLDLRQKPERGQGPAAVPDGAPQVETLDTATVGYDIPQILSMSDFPIWSEVEPPKGTVFNYPVRPWHQAESCVTGSSAPPDIAVQMWNRGSIPTMVAKLYSGNSIDQSIAWAKQELEGFVR